MNFALVALCLSAASPEPSLPSELAAPDPAAEAAPTPSHWALALEGGNPGGLSASLMYRPSWWLRVEAGALLNLPSPGARAGVTLSAFRSAVTLTGTLEAGTLFGPLRNQGAPTLAAYFIGNPAQAATNFSFVSAQGGLEAGLEDAWSFYIHAGMSYARTVGTPASPSAFGAPAAGVTVVSADALSKGVFFPSLSVGVVFYL